MRLNKATGHMSKFLTHTWHVVRGCRYGCKFCWAAKMAPRYGGDMTPCLVEEQLEGTLRQQNLIIGTSWTGEMWGPWVPEKWINRVLKKIATLPQDVFVPLTKNPQRYHEFVFPPNMILGATIESNRPYPKLTKAPTPEERYEAMKALHSIVFQKFIIIEPILEFDIDVLVRWIRKIRPVAVEIGADSGGNQLPEPKGEEVHALVEALRDFTKVLLKPNLKRIYDPQSFQQQDLRAYLDYVV